MSTEKPKRRTRYRGKNPRHFSEKYKEHAPERYAGDVAKVIVTREVVTDDVAPTLIPRESEAKKKKSA